MSSVFAANLFAGKTALITGGGTGIGYAIAEQLGRLGANLIIAARTVDTLKAAQQRLEAQAIRCDIAELNIRDADAVAELFEQLASRGTLPDILVNNAGGQFEARAVDISANGFRSVIDLNLNGTWHMSSNAGKRWIDAGMPGSIVNIVLCCDNGLPDMVHAGAARAGVINMTKSLAAGWGPYGIRVNAIAPGTIKTSGLDQYDQASLLKGVARLPISRMGTPEEIAEATAFLCSSAASYMTGTVLQVDGGEHLVTSSAST